MDACIGQDGVVQKPMLGISELATRVTVASHTQGDSVNMRCTLVSPRHTSSSDGDMSNSLLWNGNGGVVFLRPPRAPALILAL